MTVCQSELPTVTVFGAHIPRGWQGSVKHLQPAESLTIVYFSSSISNALRLLDL